MTPSELKEKRKMLRLSRKQMASILGRTPVTIGIWERGLSPVPRYVDCVLAHLGGLTDQQIDVLIAQGEMNNAKP